MVPEGRLIQIIPADEAHIDRIAKHARESDINEAAVTGQSIREGLEEGVRLSVWAWTILAEDKPIAMFGASPSPVIGIGIAWMIGTPEMDHNKIAILRRTKQFVTRMHNKVFHVLMNYVDGRNDKSIRWLKWCGFKMNKNPIHVGPDKVPFYEFTRKQTDNV